MSDQPRWPEGTPVAPSGKGPGGGRFRDASDLRHKVSGWVSRVANLIGGSAIEQPGPSLHQLQEGLESGIKHQHELVGGTSAATERVVFNNGTQAVLKTLNRDGAHQEYLGLLVGGAIGAPVPATVLGDEVTKKFLGVGAQRHEVWIGFVEGQVAASASVIASVQALAAPSTPAGRLLGLLDALVGNNDRNPGNYMIVPNNKLAGIDMGGSFASPQRHGPDSPTQFFRANQFGKYLHDGKATTRWIDHALSPEYLDSLCPKLQALQPEFERLGRLHWHALMMARFDAIRSHAKGQEWLT